MATRKEVSNRIREKGFQTPEELLDLSDYEFEQWCGKTAKDGLTPLEQSWVEEWVDLAERWVDGLEGLVDSAETQLEHAQLDLEAAEKLAESTSDWEAHDNLLEFQRTWKPKIQTFRRKVTRTLRTARRNLSALREEGAEARVKELEDAIRSHHESVTLWGVDDILIEDVELWKIVGINETAA